jgi:hypothetical protein
MYYSATKHGGCGSIAARSGDADYAVAEKWAIVDPAARFLPCSRSSCFLFRPGWGKYTTYPPARISWSHSRQIVRDDGRVRMQLAHFFRWPRRRCSIEHWILVDAAYSLLRIAMEGMLHDYQPFLLCRLALCYLQLLGSSPIPGHDVIRRVISIRQL